MRVCNGDCSSSSYNIVASAVVAKARSDESSASKFTLAVISLFVNVWDCAARLGELTLCRISSNLTTPS